MILVLKTDYRSLLLLDFVEHNTFFWGVFSLDYLSVFFAALTCFLVFCCLSISGAHTFNLGFFLGVFFLLELFLLHTFTSANLLTFYAMFEVTLIPMFLLILLWGSRQRKLHAMYMFFFYTVVGSIFLLVGVLTFFQLSGSFLLSSLTHVEPELHTASYLL